MKRTKLICSCPLLLLTVMSSRAQTMNTTRLIEGVHLQEQGRSTEAVQVLTLSIHDPHSLSVEQEGAALNALGSAYQDLGRFDQARAFYHQAVALLQGGGSGKSQLAAALDNLGSLELQMGNLDESARLRKGAHDIYAQLSDHAGISRTANNLAVIAFTKGKLHEADAYLKEAFQQTAFAIGVTNDDLASMYNLRGRLAEDRKDFSRATAAEKEALRLWLLNFSPDFYKIAVGYTALGSAEAGSGNLQQALLDLRHAMSLEMDGPGSRSSRAYFETALVYARVLKLSGDKEQAALIEADARAKLAHSVATDVTVSARSLSFR